jgi:hypothetical protein
MLLDHPTSGMIKQRTISLGLFATPMLGYGATMKMIARIAVFFCLLTVCHANESIIEYTKVRNAAELSGIVLDQSGVPISQVRVSEMTDNWNTEVRSTSTDGQGHWSFAPTKRGSTHEIQFTKATFHAVRIHVKVTKRHPKTLIVEMPVA